jgi:hypothetical protein
MRICRRPGGGGWCARNMAAAGGGGATAACSPPVVAAAIAGGFTWGAAAPGNSSLVVALEAPSAGAWRTGTPPRTGGDPMWWWWWWWWCRSFPWCWWCFGFRGPRSCCTAAVIKEHMEQQVRKCPLTVTILRHSPKFHLRHLQIAPMTSELSGLLGIPRVAIVTKTIRVGTPVEAKVTLVSSLGTAHKVTPCANTQVLMWRSRYCRST